jgi:predicted DNA-binding helix-hairpin-helix protein
MIISPMMKAKKIIEIIYDDRPYGGQSTQLIIGATSDTD